MYTIYFAANYSEKELFALHIADETGMKRYRASAYPCFFDSEQEVNAYNHLLSYCAKHQKNAPQIPLSTLFPATQVITSYIEENSTNIDQISIKTLSKQIYTFIHQEPFLPHVDINDKKFIAHAEKRNKQAYSMHADHALVELSAAISYRQRQSIIQSTMTTDTRPHYDGLLDAGLIVCVGSTKKDAQNLVERYSNITKRPLIQAIKTDLQYPVSFSDFTITLDSAALTALTYAQSIHTFGTENKLFNFTTLMYLMLMPTNVLIAARPMHVNNKQVYVCLISKKEFEKYFSSNAKTHHNVIMTE